MISNSYKFTVASSSQSQVASTDVKMPISNVKSLFLKLPIIAALLIWIANMSEANNFECNGFGSRSEKSYITLFKSLEDYLLPQPKYVKNIIYSPEYLKRPHIVGRPGFPYETQMTFRLELDSGKPATNEDSNEVAIEITIDGSQFDAANDFKASAFLPESINIRDEIYQINNNVYNFNQVLYADKDLRDSISNTELSFSDKNDLFIRNNGNEIDSYLICQKDTHYREPYCNARLSVQPFTVEIRFQRLGLTRLQAVLDQAVKFVSCLMSE